MVHPSNPDEVLDDLLASNPLPRLRVAWKTVTETFWGYDGRHGLQSIQCPTLVVHEPADRVVLMEVACKNAELLPDATFHELERTGRNALAERPREFNRLLELLIEVAASPEKWHDTLRIFPRRRSN